MTKAFLHIILTSTIGALGLSAFAQTPGNDVVSTIVRANETLAKMGGDPGEKSCYSTPVEKEADLDQFVCRFTNDDNYEKYVNQFKPQIENLARFTGPVVNARIITCMAMVESTMNATAGTKPTTKSGKKRRRITSSSCGLMALKHEGGALQQIRNMISEGSASYDSRYARLWKQYTESLEGGESYRPEDLTKEVVCSDSTKGTALALFVGAAYYLLGIEEFEQIQAEEVGARKTTLDGNLTWPSEDLSKKNKRAIDAALSNPLVASLFHYNVGPGAYQSFYETKLVRPGKRRNNFSNHLQKIDQCMKATDETVIFAGNPSPQRRQNACLNTPKRIAHQPRPKPLVAENL